MYAAQGVGLAANQVGVGQRVFVYDCPDDEDVRHLGHIVNPRLVVADGVTVRGPEGCLSLPGLEAGTVRHDHAVVEGVTADGDPVRVEGTGFFARCLQHECDHLEGLVYPDRLTGRRRAKVLRAARRAKWARGYGPQKPGPPARSATAERRPHSRSDRLRTNSAREQGRSPSHQSPAACIMPTMPWPHTRASCSPVGSEVHPVVDHLGELLAEPAQQRRRVAADVEAGLRLLDVLGRMHQEAVDLRPRLDGGEIGVQGGLDPLAAVRRSVERRAQRGEQRVGVALGEGAVEAALVAEVAVQDGLGDARLRGDGVHGGLRAVPEHHSVRRLEKLAAALVGGRSFLFGRLLCGLHMSFSPPVRLRDACAN